MSKTSTARPKAAPPLTINGRCEPGFARVRDAFAANFERDDDYREVGAALAVYRAGKPVVDLWAGHADRAQTRSWQRDTLINVYSTTKGIVAIAIAKLVDQGVLDYEDKVTRFWPEYGEAGKQDTTIAQLLSHQAGLTGFMAPTTVEDLYDWNASCAQLASQPPCWAPGSQNSYHAMTWGFLVGEVLRRAAHQRVGEFVARHIAQPMEADVFIGLPQHEEIRVAEMLRPRNPPDLSALTQPMEALMALVNPQLDPEVCNQRAWRAAQIPAANGQASAQGIARPYAALANGGSLEGRRLISAAAIGRMMRIQSERSDLLLGFTGNWSMGMCFNQMNMLGPLPDTFGHGGWGGSLACCNVEAGVAIGYVCNQMGAQLVGDPRGMGLCHAVFECL